MQVQKLGGHSPRNIREPKTCKISVDFGPLQTLIANISGMTPDIQKRKEMWLTANSNSSRVPRKKFHDPHTKKVLLARIEPPKWIFRGRLHLGPWGVLPPQIFIRARDWPSLYSTHPNWDGVPPKTFDRENLKFGLKFSVLATTTSELVGISSQPDDVMNFGPQTIKLQRVC